MANTGKFITVEGQDGAGKTTSIRFVERMLHEQGLEPVVTREPGGTRLGEALRRIVLEGHEFRIDSMAELLMIFAARAQHLAETIRPALEGGQWVVCDRFTDATFAYQSGGRGLPWSSVETLESLVREHQSALIGYAYRMVRDWELAQDLVQEAFVRYLRSPLEYGEPRQRAAWLFRVTRNLCIDVGKRESRREDVHGKAAAPACGGARPGAWPGDRRGRSARRDPGTGSRSPLPGHRGGRG